MTTQHEDRLAGVTVSSFNTLSLDPPLVLWSRYAQAARSVRGLSCRRQICGKYPFRTCERRGRSNF
ncbi:flavin reductase family protein [Paracoccus mutanolyticus]|nr:flavin reductase family protein [Paracoccus mutanolyticus]